MYVVGTSMCVCVCGAGGRAAGATKCVVCLSHAHSIHTHIFSAFLSFHEDMMCGPKSHRTMDVLDMGSLLPACVGAVPTTHAEPIVSYVTDTVPYRVARFSTASTLTAMEKSTLASGLRDCKSFKFAVRKRRCQGNSRSTRSRGRWDRLEVLGQATFQQDVCSLPVPELRRRQQRLS